MGLLVADLRQSRCQRRRAEIQGWRQDLDAWASRRRDLPGAPARERASALIPASEGFSEVSATTLATADGSVLAATGSGIGGLLFHRGPGPAAAWQELPWKTSYISSRRGTFYAADGLPRASADGGTPLGWSTSEGAAGNLVLGDGWQLIIRTDNTRLLCADGKACARWRNDPGSSTSPRTAASSSAPTGPWRRLGGRIARGNAARNRE